MGVGYSPALWGGGIAAFKVDCGPEAPIPCAADTVFPITPPFGAVVDEQVLGAQAAGATKLAVAACAEVEACSQAGPVFEATTKAVGLEFGGGRRSAPPPPTTPPSASSGSATVSTSSRSAVVRHWPKVCTTRAPIRGTTASGRIGRLGERQDHHHRWHHLAGIHGFRGSSTTRS
jgi:hypothetical protein